MKDPEGRLSHRRGPPSELRGNPEFQSALVRITVCLLGASYIGLGAWTGYYEIDIGQYLAVFALYLLFSLALLISVVLRADWPARRYLALCLDVITVSFAISLTQAAISPFYLLYILIFISAGTRFGKGHLVVASVVAVVAYNFVLIHLDEWHRHTFEAAFFLLLLVLLPLYQASLLRQVQQAREDAERANRAKGDFLAFMTHELRTPLTGVIGMTELLKDTRLDLEQRDYVQAIATSASSLNALIGDILDFSKIDARKLTLERTPFDPRLMAREVCEILSAQALARGLDLICRVEPEVPPQVTGDPLRVRQILFNLIGNAIKFTEHGEVVLRERAQPADAALDRPHLLLEVIDTGIGIPKDTLPVLFESFRQADDSTTRRFGGTGLGTTIARDLILLMGGSIEVESEEGRGSLFRVRLPLLDEGWVSAAPAPAGRLLGLRALLVEPNRTQAAWLCDVLTREGARCRDLAEAPSPTDSGSMRGRAEAAPDLIVLSDTLAGGDLPLGLAKMRTAFAEPLPCLLLTYAGRRLPQPPAGVLCLNKPFLPEDLVAAIEHLLGRAISEGALGESGDAESDRRAGAIPPASAVRVLVAEDNAIAARVITTFLTKMGFAHDLFQDGESALAAALGGGYQLAIVDLRMPSLDGIGFTRRYRAEAPDRPLPIVALTANAAEETRRDCLKAGMDGFLAKPVSPEDLRAVVERLALAPASSDR